ncbi:cyclase family protein [Leucobacter massiliensis]|uniref:Cyclase n=1 Tax=Leucobacter massiliensis TaxID=1686285 RepID=A0A2S9QQ66_9MICO|nr:cyclase family protein [Leucobacter massiliensis]PRI11733.1 hypothetical protein B4915_04635 [Leucobacter massiliensis]
MIDLSQPIADGMMVYPGDPQVTMREALSLAVDGVAVCELHLGSHSGTHVDAPAHTVAGGRTIDEIPLERLSGEARVLRLADRVGPGHRIEAGELGLMGVGSLPAIVAIHTGWDRHFGGAAATNHPYLSRDAAELLWRLGMRVLVVDTLSPDQTGAPTADPGHDAPSGGGPVFPVHEVVLGGDGIIVENARGLGRLGERCRIGIFPLPLAGADGAPARVVAWPDEGC